MEPFTIYVIVCVAMWCRDIAPPQTMYFSNSQACTSFVGGMLNTFTEAAKKNELVLSDARAFCMVLTKPEEGAKT